VQCVTPAACRARKTNPPLINLKEASLSAVVGAILLSGSQYHSEQFCNMIARHCNNTLGLVALTTIIQTEG